MSHHELAEYLQTVAYVIMWLWFVVNIYFHNNRMKIKDRIIDLQRETIKIQDETIEAQRQSIDNLWTCIRKENYRHPNEKYSQN